MSSIVHDRMFWSHPVSDAHYIGNRRSKETLRVDSRALGIVLLTWLHLQPNGWPALPRKRTDHFVQVCPPAGRYDGMWANLAIGGSRSRPDLVEAGGMTAQHQVARLPQSKEVRQDKACAVSG